MVGPIDPSDYVSEFMQATFVAVEDHKTALGSLQLRLPFMGRINGKLALDLEGEFDETDREQKVEIQAAMEQCMGSILNALMKSDDFKLISEEEAMKLKKHSGHHS